LRGCHVSSASNGLSGFPQRQYYREALPYRLLCKPVLEFFVIMVKLQTWLALTS
jgi:hypothetical protein